MGAAYAAKLLIVTAAIALVTSGVLGKKVCRYGVLGKPPAKLPLARRSLSWPLQLTLPSVTPAPGASGQYMLKDK